MPTKHLAFGSGSELATPPGRRGKDRRRVRERGLWLLGAAKGRKEGRKRKERKERVRGLMGDINFWAIILQEGEGEGGQEK